MPDYKREATHGLEHRRRHADRFWHWRLKCEGWPHEDEQFERNNGNHLKPPCPDCGLLDPDRSSHG